MSIPKDDYVGKPNYPAPWTTKSPKEGLRDDDAAKIISLAPDVCLTPVGSAVVPIPYPIVDFCGHDTTYTPSVRFTRRKAMVRRSCTSHVHGDQPGVKKGVKSGTVGDVCTPVGYADEVRAEGSHVIRHLDRFDMNKGNTTGEAIFVRNLATYSPPVDNDPVPGSLRWAAGEPVQLAFASTGSTATTTDAGSPSWTPPQTSGQSTAGGGAPSSTGTARSPAQTLPRPQTPSIPKLVGRGLLRRFGIFGYVIEDELRTQSLSESDRRAEGLSQVVMMSNAGQTVIRTDKLLGGRSPASSPLDLFRSSTWQGKYGVFINPDERIPLGNDIMSRLAGRQVDLRSLSDAEVNDILSPFQGLSDQQIEQKLRERAAPPVAKEPDPDREPKPRPLPDTVRVSERDRYRRRCQVDTYRVMEPICKQYGMQAHHIVPDWTLRYGTRIEAKAGQKRIPNMPGYWDGQSICVVGNARTGGTEHNSGHTVDAVIERMGSTSTPPNTAIVEAVKRESIKAMTSVRPDCAAQIIAGVNKEFRGVDDNQLLRAKQYPPLPPETLKALSSGAAAGANSVR